MQNALQEPQSIVLLGGTSDIGTAIVDELISANTRTVVLACRNPLSADTQRFTRGGVEVLAEQFDATETATHEALVDRIVHRCGDIDVVVMAFGVLGSQAEFDVDSHSAVSAVHANYTGAVSILLVAANQLRRQGHGHIVVLSSVAGERVRAANFIYGSSKAGLDAFAQGLGDSLAGSGVSVTVVRPGFVHSTMTEGRKPAPFATTPQDVAKLTVAAMRAGHHTVWAPTVLRYVFMVLRHLPRGIFRRLPLG